jgi:hypothetical protein
LDLSTRIASLVKQPIPDQPLALLPKFIKDGDSNPSAISATTELCDGRPLLRLSSTDSELIRVSRMTVHGAQLRHHYPVAGKLSISGVSSRNCLMSISKRGGISTGFWLRLITSLSPISLLSAALWMWLI